MNYKEIDNFIEIEVHPIYQNGVEFFVGKLSANLLLDTYTVRPTEYDLEAHRELANTFEDEIDYFNELIAFDEKQIKDKNFQRNFNKNRLKSITEYLNNEPYPLFPNAVVVNCDLINKYGEESEFNISNKADFYTSNNKPQHLSFLDTQTNTLIIPKRKGSILVIDGQHRIKGLEASNIKNNYEVLLAFIIGVDRTVVAKQFYTVNYEQKSVNKSLLYHLTGEFSNEIDELSLMHNVVRALNELDGPLNGRIKMLGVNPSNVTADEKAKLSLSQAFLVDALLKTVSKNALKGTYLPIFLFQYVDKDNRAQIIKFLIKYFKAVENLKEDWNFPDQSLLSKGMGVGALLKVLQLIFPVIFKKEIREYNRDELKIGEAITTEQLQKYLSGLESVDFLKNGSFGGVGSSGSVNKIKEAIIENLSYLKEIIGYNTYQDFLSKSSGYKDEFQKFLIKKS